MSELLVLEPEEKPKINLPELVRRYANGESLTVLAQENSVSRQTIYNWIFSDIGGEEHQEIVTKCLINRIAESDEEMEKASSVLDIARARERMKFHRMDFERRRPKLYGQTREVKQDTTVRVVVERRQSPKLLDSKDIDVETR
jgi:hypothetical protein